MGIFPHTCLVITYILNKDGCLRYSYLRAALECLFMYLFCTRFIIYSQYAMLFSSYLQFFCYENVMFCDYNFYWKARWIYMVEDLINILRVSAMTCLFSVFSITGVLWLLNSFSWELVRMAFFCDPDLGEECGNFIVIIPDASSNLAVRSLPGER